MPTPRHVISQRSWLVHHGDGRIDGIDRAGGFRNNVPADDVNLSSGTMTVQGRLGSGLGKLVVFLLICGPLLNVHGILRALPTPFQLILFASAGVYIIKRLLDFKRWNDELAHVRKFIAAFFLLLSVVIVENFCTW